MATPSALLLSGSLGMGHDVMAEACAVSLRRRGWTTDTVDSMRMMGHRRGGLGEGVFRGMLAVPGLYDAFHFGQLRSGGRLARFIDAASCRYLVPALDERLRDRPVELLVSVFATGAAAAGRIKERHPDVVNAVFCTDTCPHRLWVHDNTDLYLVTSDPAARYIRRFDPDAEIAVVPAPVRPQFYLAPTQAAAREALGVPPDAECVLLISGAWGIGPLVEAADLIARAGVHVLAVAGRNAGLESRLRSLAAATDRIVPFGFSDEIPTLMAAADLVVTSSGDTCAEARVIGRDLLLLDVVPGHGRENLHQELVRGGAAVTSAQPEAIRRSVSACLQRVEPSSPRVAVEPTAWEEAFGAVLERVGPAGWAAPAP
ncbi:glycosyl hydrolase [Nocardia violaceofusca]|uniref:glycosyl hydrolase n=1 Tax=Nocardia violaceofusca TaxID=941182 RepID=UPI0007A3D3FB|nr:glycosyl hydrolase [Nocardia violaceofusca]